MRSTRIIVATAAVLAISACSSTPPPPPPAPPMPTVSTAKMAEANLSPASASIVSGRLAVVPDPRGGVHITGVIGGLQPLQTAAFHVHERGDCSAVDASSAGDYYDPRTGARQGGAVGETPGRIIAGPDGVSRVDLLVPGAVLGGGADNDIAGRALLVLGATPGAISARVACGIVTISR